MSIIFKTKKILTPPQEIQNYNIIKSFSNGNLPCLPNKTKSHFKKYYIIINCLSVIY